MSHVLIVLGTGAIWFCQLTAQPPRPPPFEPTVQVRMSEPERTPAFSWSPGPDSKAWVPLCHSTVISFSVKAQCGCRWLGLPVFGLSWGDEVWSRYSRKEPVVVGCSDSALCYLCRWKGEKQCAPQGPVEFLLGSGAWGWEHYTCGLTIFRTLMMSPSFPEFQALHLKLHIFDRCLRGLHACGS